MPFEYFKPQTGAALITIASYGITFSPGAIEELKNPDFISFAIDTENKLLGVQKCEDGDDRSIEFKKLMRSDGVIRIMNKKLLRYLESKTKGEYIYEKMKGKKYLGEWDSDNEMLIFHLDKPID